VDLLQRNPFTTIKANDLNDAEINEQWVDAHGGFYDLFLPNNKVSQYLLGGKGSGKTHLMRYFSYSSQMIRNSSDVIGGIEKDGYFAIYFQASGLNGDRFERLPFDLVRRNVLFEYSFELWCAGLIIQALMDLKETNIEAEDEPSFCASVLSLFSVQPDFEVSSLPELKLMFKSLSNKIDYAVSNAYFTKDFDIEILAERGALIFGLPALIAKTITGFKDVTFLYLIDELENISLEQQKYLNTLLREKKLPCSFRLGSRGYGIKTYKTLGAGEENREGHEFEKIRLDDILSESDDYKEFAVNLIINRLEKAGFISQDQEYLNVFKGSFEEKILFLKSFFESPDLRDLFNFADKGNTERTSRMSSLKNKIQGKGISSKTAEGIISNLSFASAPLIEAAKIHLFSQYWATGEKAADELIEEAEKIAQIAQEFSQTLSHDSPIFKKFTYYKSNYLASALRARSQNNMEQYLGIEELLQVTKGFPRHILTVLRNIYKAEVFAGNTPFTGSSKISLKSQKLALLETAKWFHGECSREGVLGENVTNALENLCELLREEMYADKPVECSASSFTVDESELHREVIDLIKWAVLIRVLVKGKPRQDKNSQRMISRYHVNSLLCPMWGLAVGRRGALNLRPDEVSFIFLKKYKKQFEGFISNFSKSRNLPFTIKVTDQFDMDF
jgi:hypothetical protein